ncbi:MAG: trypsin-like serine protease [Burkholderiales bacterium]
MPIAVRFLLISLVVVCLMAGYSARACAVTGGVAADAVLADPSRYTVEEVALANAVSATTVPLLGLDAAGRQISLCSASVVHPRVVLTAAHCLFIGGGVNRRLAVQFDGGSGAPERRQAIDIAVHPRFLDLVQGGKYRPGAGSIADLPKKRRAQYLASDLALVLLDRPIPATHGVVEMVPDGFRDSLATPKVIAGYGQMHKSVRLKDLTLRFAGLRGNTRDLQGVVGGGGEIVMESRYRNGTKVNVCSGDSGGPVFVLQRGAPGLRQIAVASAADLRCREFAIFAPIDGQRAVLSWMFEALMKGEEGRTGNPF